MRAIAAICLVMLFLYGGAYGVLRCNGSLVRRIGKRETGCQAQGCLNLLGRWSVRQDRCVGGIAMAHLCSDMSTGTRLRNDRGNMTTSIQLWLLSISVILEATVFLRHLFVPPTLGLDWTIICGVLIGLSLFPVLLVVRHGTPGPRVLAAILAILPTVYIYAQVTYWLQG